MTTTPRVYQQGASTYVIGTDDMQLACQVLGIAPETHRWGSTDAGFYVRRRGGWLARSDDAPPKDAKRGVCFRGPITAHHPEDT